MEAKKRKPAERLRPLRFFERKLARFSSEGFSFETQLDERDDIHGSCNANAQSQVFSNVGDQSSIGGMKKKCDHWCFGTVNLRLVHRIMAHAL